VSARSALRRFLLLTGLRWLVPGLLFPVLVLLPLQRGLSLSQLGLAPAMQGLVVPDRRPILYGQYGGPPGRQAVPGGYSSRWD
jgi:hypothetical protein